jgi:anaerobic selenocysteine-containing dehydrogenase
MADGTIRKALRVSQLVATRRGDPERGPQVRLNPQDAAERLLVTGELAWVYGPRRHELAEVVIDEAVGRGEAVIRDIAGSSPSELIRVVKPDFDSRGRKGALA